jgi:hypothetical protein
MVESVVGIGSRVSYTTTPPGIAKIAHQLFLRADL